MLPKLIFRLHAENPNCRYCDRETLPPRPDGKAEFPLTATIDHMIPRARGGGGADVGNVTLACRDCNELKGNMTVDEFAEAVHRAVERGRVFERTASGHFRQLFRPINLPAREPLATLADVWPLQSRRADGNV